MVSENAKEKKADSSKNNTPLVSIIVVTRNSARFNEKFFDSIENQTYKNIEVIAVDNESTDNTRKVVQKRLKRGMELESGGDFGFAMANNIGAEKASGKYLFFLNHDAWIDKHCIENLVKLIAKEPYAIYAPKQLTYDGKGFLSCGVSGDLFGYPGRAYSVDGKTQTRPLFFADGAAFFLTKELYIKVGMMDEYSYLYAEDNDLSWKIHLVGAKMLPALNAIVYHFGGGSIGIGGHPDANVRYETTYNKRFWAEKNTIRNILKNYSIWNVMWILPFYLLVNLAEIIVMALTLQFGAISQTYLKAYIWNIKNLESTIAKRKHIQSIRKVPDSQVMKFMSFVPNKYYALLELGVPKVG